MRSTTSMSSGSSTTTHTQWCDQDTGDTSSAVNATVTTAIASSPRRCASTASARARHRHHQGRDHPEHGRAGRLPEAAQGEPAQRLVRDERGAVAARDARRVEEQAVQPVRGGRLRGGHPAGRVITAKAPRGHGGRAEAAGQHQVHHEDPGDELAGRRDPDADPFPADPVGQRQIGDDQQHQQGVDLPEAEVRADRLEPQRQPGDGDRPPRCGRRSRGSPCSPLANQTVSNMRGDARSPSGRAAPAASSSQARGASSGSVTGG